MRTKTSRFSWVFGVLGAWASYAGVVIAPGCGATDTDNGGTDSNTHWLEPCERDSQCDEGLSCVCGVCTAPCEDDDACSALDGASCALANTCAGPREETSCVVGCSNDRDCGDLGTSFVCDDGQCVHGSIAPTGGSGGQTGEPGGEAGAPAGAIGGNGGSAGAPPTGGSGAIAGSAGGPSGGRAAGTGGSAGSGAIAGAGAPSTGGTGPTGPCAPMDVQETLLNLPCLPGAPTYYWNGNFCTQFSACECVGEDCDERYPTMAACDQSYQACYEELGMTGECETDDDCKLTYRGCCASCGVQTFESLAATNAADEALWHYCPTDAACPECIPAGPTAEAEAKCEAGRCRVTSICEPLDATDCDAAELCDPVYARFPGELDKVYVGCRYSGEDATMCSEGPTCGIVSDPAADATCMTFDTNCQPRDFSTLDCSSTACQP